MKRSLRKHNFTAPFCVAVGLVAVFMPARAGAEPPTAKELRDIVRAQEETAKAEAQAARMSLIQEAIKLSQQDKEVARDELQKVTKARAELRHKINVRNWALDSFEARDRGITPPARVSKYLSHLETVRSVYREKFLNQQYASRGEVKSGKALNFFLDACGSVALNHQLLRDQIPDLLVQPDLPPTRTLCGN